jgi:hypothetical protein
VGCVPDVDGRARIKKNKGAACSCALSLLHL